MTAEAATKASTMTDHELQFRLLFAITVAGKSASHAEKVLKRLFEKSSRAPIDRIRRWVADGELEGRLKTARTGNYGKLSKAFSQVAAAIAEGKLDLQTCSAGDLEAFHGVGPKTSRFFITWTRPDARHAVLDVHVLRWLKKRGHDVPQATPSSRQQYARIENIFLAIADTMGKTPRQLDAAIWAQGSGYEGWNPDDHIVEADSMFTKDNG